MPKSLITLLKKYIREWHIIKWPALVGSWWTYYQDLFRTYIQSEISHFDTIGRYLLLHHLSEYDLPESGKTHRFKLKMYRIVFNDLPF